jgi:hypothetical protein
MVYFDRPYKGRIIDMETKEPIEGMAVFAKYYIKTPSPGGPVTSREIAREVITDKNGVFKLPLFLRIGFNPLHYLYEVPSLTIFKPGFHRASADWTPLMEYSYKKIDKPLSSHKLVTVEIKRLKTLEEREENMKYFSYPVGNYHKNKYMLFRYYNQERINVGLDPIPELHSW